jgi:hypothetical protein
MKLLNEVIKQLEDIESSLNQDEPNVSDIRIDVTSLLNLLHDEQAFKEEKFHQVPMKHFTDDFHEGK